MLWGLPLRTGVEAETMLTDVQALEREVNRKRRDAGIGRMILLVKDSRRNREVLQATDALRRAFPLGTRAVLTALTLGREPRGDGVVIL